MWERSFLAVSVLVGAGVDDAIGALDAEGAARSAALAQTLRDPRRAARAQALAAVAQDVARAIEDVTLR